MGVIYGPQQNVTSNSELKKLYESISVYIGKKNNQQIIILGDFNAKIRNYIKKTKKPSQSEGNTWLVEKQNLCIVNGQSNKCEGLWTREQWEEKSVKDFVIPTKRDLNTIKTMKIDEEKVFGIYKVERKGTKQSRKIYSDHNAKYSLHQQNGSKRLEKIITWKGYQKYKKVIKERKISKIT